MTTSSLSQRTGELYRLQRQAILQRVNRSITLLMACQYVAALGWALFSPFFGFWPTLLLATLYTGVPTGMVWLRPDFRWSGQVIAAGQMGMATLLIMLSGGQIETHFHVFGSLAFLAFYRNGWVLLTGSVVIVLFDLVGGLFFPALVFGSPTASPWRWLEHAGWVGFADVFLMVAIRQHQNILWKAMETRAELESARDLAVQASEAKDHFLAVLSHELRTPLTPCLMTLSVLGEDETLTGEHREEIELVRRNVELEARLIDDLLDLTRIANGKLQLHAGHVDLHGLLQQIFKTCRPEFAAKGVELALLLQARRQWLYGDNARLQQVFWNLLKNALKFTPAGGRVEVHTTDAGEQIRVDVLDNGVGIEAEVLPRIFNRFEQGGTQVTRQFGGLGLGLSICHAIVEMHRGSIAAASEGPGRGAAFSVFLPARLETTKTARPKAQTQMLRLAGHLPRRVLLVDDHAETRETMAKLLGRAGYEVATAENVASALERAAAAPFDMLVSDIGLPDGTGHELMRAVKERYGYPGVALSGFGMEEDMRRSEEAGFSAHLTKPVDFPRLKEVMSETLRRREGRGGE